VNTLESYSTARTANGQKIKEKINVELPLDFTNAKQRAQRKPREPKSTQQTDV
jgi:hypothetical protein